MTGRVASRGAAGMRGSGECGVELGEVIGSLAVKVGAQPLLLLFSENALVLARPRFGLARSLVTLGVRFESLLDVREIVRLSRMGREELRKRVEELVGEGRLLIAGLIPLDRVVKVVLRKGLLGGVKLEIHVAEGRRITLGLVYGVRAGISRGEAVELAERLAGEAGLALEERL